ncbi:MAG: hypothetical protein JKY22_11935 [Flavobacteriaceae bacterium]|nr:hypothetical protein [Flavobacteriaceae bacterium]
MKYIYVILGLFIYVTANSQIGGSGLCEVDADPNTIQRLEVQLTDECKYVYFEGVYYKHYPNLPVGENWIIEVQSLISDIEDGSVYLNPQLANSTSALPEPIGENSIDLQTDRAAGYHAVTGDNSIALGQKMTVWNQYSIGIGYETSAFGNYGTSMGYKSRTNHSGATAIGNDVITRSLNEVVLGAFNENSFISDGFNWNLKDKVFSIGNGTSSAASLMHSLFLNQGR